MPPRQPDRLSESEAGEGTLNADELGPVRFAVIVEPVGEDEPRRVVVRVGGDRFQQGAFLRHDSSSARGVEVFYAAVPFTPALCDVVEAAITDLARDIRERLAEEN